VDDLNLTFENFDQSFPEWLVDLDIVLDAIVVDGKEIPKTSLSLDKENLLADAEVLVHLSEQVEPKVTLKTTFDPATADEVQTAWTNSTSVVQTELRSVSRFLNGIAPALGLPTPEDGWPEGTATFTSTVNLVESKAATAQASLDFNDLSWSEAVFREGQLQVNYEGEEAPLKATLNIQQSADSALAATAHYQPKTQSYQATFNTSNFLADSLQPFIRLSVGELPLAGRINLDWEGSGELPKPESHQGRLDLNQTHIAVNSLSPITLNVAAEYDGLSQIDINSIDVAQDDQKLFTELHWNGERIEVPRLILNKAGRDIIMGGRASLPFRKDQDFAQYFNDESPWSVELNADRLDIPETAALFGASVPEGLQGILTLDASVSGSPANPSISGKLRLDRFELEKVSQLPVTDANLSWATAGESLTLDGTITPEGRNPIVINGSTAFLPKKWSENPESILKEAFDLQINAPNVDLSPFAELSPQVTVLEGSVALLVQASGTFEAPQLQGHLDLDLTKGRTTIERLRRLRKTTLKVNLEGDTISIAPSSFSTDGGIIGISGTVGIAEPTNPAFDLTVTGDKLLLWRDDNINSRADAFITLKGSLEAARIAGDIGIVESLFYKDIELLPLNVPVTTPKAPSLPKFSSTRTSSTKSADRVPVPAPFGGWSLDLRAYTADPFLIRGNLTDGEVKGEIFAKGTIANPILTGGLEVSKLEATLPFSTLEIEGGKVGFTPEDGFIPNLDIRAISNIDSYEVNIFVGGSATSPEVVFSSTPPLPEAEIITLIATGTTPAGLEDADAAKAKAFQLLIEQVRRAPPGSRLHPFAKIAEPLKDAKIQVAGADPFTGKRRNSISIPLPESEHWQVSAAVDSESETRGLIIYLLRFH